MLSSSILPTRNITTADSNNGTATDTGIGTSTPNTSHHNIDRNTLHHATIPHHYHPHHHPHNRSKGNKNMETTTTTTTTTPAATTTTTSTTTTVWSAGWGTTLSRGSTRHHHRHRRRLLWGGSCAEAGICTATCADWRMPRLLRIRFFGVFQLLVGAVLIAFTIHRMVALTLTTKKWVPAPIQFLERDCPTGDSYETLASSTGTGTTTTTTTTAGSTRSRTQPKICMTTLTDQQHADGWQRLLKWRNFDSLLTMTWPNKQAYCDKHGYTLFDSSFLLDTSRPPSWSKIKAAQYGLLHLQCDWVVWLDADTVIMNSQKRLEDILPNHHDHDHQRHHYDLVITKQKEISYNAGAWMIRNSPWSLHFLDTWWNMDEFVRVKGLSVSGDNDALYHYLTQDMPPSEFKDHIVVPPRCTFNSVTKWVSPQEAKEYQRDPDKAKQEQWYMHEEYYHKGDLIAHVAGRNNKIDTTRQLLKYAT